MDYDKTRNAYVERYAIKLYSRETGEHILCRYNDKTGKWEPNEFLTKTFAEAKLSTLQDDLITHVFIQIGDGIILRSDDIAAMEVVKV